MFRLILLVTLVCLCASGPEGSGNELLNVRYFNRTSRAVKQILIFVGIRVPASSGNLALFIAFTSISQPAAFPPAGLPHSAHLINEAANAGFLLWRRGRIPRGAAWPD